MEIEEIISIIKKEFDRDESGIDWQEEKYKFDNFSNNIYDIKVNSITIPFVCTLFLNNDELLVFGKGDATLAIIPREIIETLEVIKK